MAKQAAEDAGDGYTYRMETSMLPAHIVKLTPEVNAKVLDGGLARFMPDATAPSTEKNQLGWALLQSKSGKWRLYKPSGVLAGIAANKNRAEAMFRTHYKRELRNRDQGGTARFMPEGNTGDAANRYRQAKAKIKTIESKISELGGWADWQRGDPRYTLNEQRGDLQMEVNRLEVPYLREVTPHYDDIRTSLPDGAAVKDVRPYVIYRGESGPPEITSITWTGGGGYSNVSSSQYPFIEATLSNGGKLLKQVRISDHPQVSVNAPRHYDVDLRLEGNLFNNKGQITKKSQAALREALDDVVDAVWREQKEILK